MRLLFTAHFNRAYNDAPKPIQQASDKQSMLLLQNLRHPSLRAKKYSEAKDKWRLASIRTGGSTFRIVGDAYIMTDITRHPK